MPGVPCPLAGRQVGDIDMMVVRENNEGEYSSIGGRLYEGTDQEMAVQQSVFTRQGVDRILKIAFDIAQSRRPSGTSLRPPSPTALPSPCLTGTSG